ncbi:MAG: hypothetical protein ACLFR0_08950 [Alphaproteobacteria bacterium]
MSRPNAQYPRGKKTNTREDDAKYQEDKEKLEKQEEQDSFPKRNKH